MAIKKARVAPTDGSVIPPTDDDQQYVKKEEFESAVSTILDKLEAISVSRTAAPETPEQKEIKAAAPNRVEKNPDWDEMAVELLGDYLDHTEVEHTKSGGILFTIVVKKERSNAGKDYLMMVGQDRRTKEVGSEGLEGVIQWCKLVRANLKRGEDMK